MLLLSKDPCPKALEYEWILLQAGWVGCVFKRELSCSYRTKAIEYPAALKQLNWPMVVLEDSSTA